MIPYILNTEFDAYIDQYALKWLMTINDPSGWLIRWRLRLSEFVSEFVFKVNYKKE